jgi:hypothetical protein
MKSSKKILTTVLSAVALLIIAILVFVDLFADRAVKLGIETAATKALSVGVDVNDVDLAITRGILEVSGLVVSNPPGYQHRKLLDLRRAKVTAEAKSFLGDQIRIKKIKIEDVAVTLEQRGLSNNLQDVINAIPKAQQTEPAGAEGRKLRIDSLEIYGIKVQAKLLPVPGKMDTITLELPPIKMTNLGSDKKLDTVALSAEIFLAIANGVVKQGVGKLPQEMIQTMSSTLGMTLKIGKDLIEGGKVLGEGVFKGTENIGKGITDAVGGLLDPKKKKD